MLNVSANKFFQSIKTGLHELPFKSYFISLNQFKSETCLFTGIKLIFSKVLMHLQKFFLMHLRRQKGIVFLFQL